MASGPTWNPQRRSWYVQYHDGSKWRRVTVAKGPPRWQEGDPVPRVPPEAKAAFARWQEAEEAAREARSRGAPAALATFLEGHVASYPKAGTRKIVRLAVDQFLAWCAEEGINRFDEVDRAACNRFFRWAADRPGAPTHATMRTRRAYLAAAWGRLVREEVIDRNPWRGSEVRGEKKAKPRDAWTIDQLARLIDHAEPWLRDVIMVGVNTGLRIEALMGLRWDDWIHPQPGEAHLGYIRVREEVSKTGEYRVPVSAALQDVLARRFGRHDPIYVLTAKRGAPLKYPTQTHKAIVRACAAAGLPRPRSPNHHLRRSFGRFAVLGHLTGKPVPIFVASKWLGHKNPRTTLIYLGLSEEDSAKWMVPRAFAEGEEVGSDQRPESTHL